MVREPYPVEVLAGLVEEHPIPHEPADAPALVGAALDEATAYHGLSRARAAHQQQSRRLTRASHLQPRGAEVR